MTLLPVGQRQHFSLYDDDDNGDDDDDEDDEDYEDYDDDGLGKGFDFHSYVIVLWYIEFYLSSVALQYRLKTSQNACKYISTSALLRRATSCKVHHQHNLLHYLCL